MVAKKCRNNLYGWTKYTMIDGRKSLRRVGGKMYSGSSALCVNAKVMSGRGNVRDKFSDMEKMK